MKKGQCIEIESGGGFFRNFRRCTAGDWNWRKESEGGRVGKEMIGAPTERNFLGIPNS